MATLEQLKAEHPEWCFTCGKYWLEPGGIHTCHENPLLSALITAEREDEARATELEKQLQLRIMAHELDKLGLDKLWRERDSLQSQLTAEQQAHAETRRQLDSMIVTMRAIVRMASVEDADMRHIIRETAQASINRPANQPTDDPNSYLEKCPQCGGEADNGHDRCLPPNPYLCSKCTDDRGEGEK